MLLQHQRNIALALFTVGALSTNQTCKTTPSDTNWPSTDQWAALNASIDGTLLKTNPIAASCFNSTSFTSNIPCDIVEANWTQAVFHASLPETIDYPIYANSSCVPPSILGQAEQRGCTVGGSPQYVVNATSEAQIAAAMKWATSHNIRIVVKGTGHDMNGRSSGAYSLSIWTHNFRQIMFDAKWLLPGSNDTADVVIAGSGNNWGLMYAAAGANGKSVVGGEAPSVGLGGFVQGGGHGPLSSHYGLAADQIYQAKIVTVTGKILIANSEQNQDLLWAVRGGGAGQYGVVTEYVMKVHPAPTSVVVGSLSLSFNGTTNTSVAEAWNAFAIEVRSIPDLMDAGLSGQATIFTGMVNGMVVPSSVTHNFYSINTTAASMTSLLQPVIAAMGEKVNTSNLAITWTEPTVYPSYTSFAENLAKATTNVAGLGSMMSSRLLGRDQLTNNFTQEQIVANLQRVFQAQSPSAGATMVIGMQGGKGPANVPENMRGALHSSWRTAYLHVITLGATIDATADPQTTLTSAAKWVNENTEVAWRNWAPEMGAYMNEANPYDTAFKADYYGSSYERLLQIKKAYDPTGSLFVLSGVGSDTWDYNLNTGKLCQVSTL